MSHDEKMAVFIFLSSGILIAVYEVSYWLLKWRQKAGRGIFKKQIALLFHFLTILTIVSLLYAYYIEPTWVEVKVVNIQTKKLKKTTLKIAHISDLHCETKMRNEVKIIAAVNAFKPDIIVFTGDAVNTPAAIPVFQKTLRELKAKVGKFAVRGNWDVRAWPSHALFDGTGFELVEEKTVQVQMGGEIIYISGLSPFADKYSLFFLRKIPGDVFSLVLHHYPDLIEEMKQQPITLYLSGHSHGGQIALPFYGAIITLSKFGKKYESGLYPMTEDTWIYVNRGVGLDGGPAPQMRFFARPEVTLLTMQPRGHNNGEPQ